MRKWTFTSAESKCEEFYELQIHQILPHVQAHSALCSASCSLMGFYSLTQMHMVPWKRPTVS